MLTPFIDVSIAETVSFSNSKPVVVVFDTIPVSANVLLEFVLVNTLYLLPLLSYTTLPAANFSDALKLHT